MQEATKEGKVREMAGHDMREILEIYDVAEYGERDIVERKSL